MTLTAPTTGPGPAPRRRSTAWTAATGSPTTSPVVVERGRASTTSQFRSTDVAGNAEADQVAPRLRVDRTAPVTAARINGAAPQAEYTGAVRVGVHPHRRRRLWRRVARSTGSATVDWTAYTGAFDLDGNRGHRVDFRSRDLVGNVENFRSVTFVIRPGPAPPGEPPPRRRARPARAFAALEALGASALDGRRVPRRPARGARELPGGRSAGR